MAGGSSGDTMMKLLLATMMIVCGLIGPANADQLPKEFVGKYCGLGPYLRDEENRCFNTKGEITRDDGLEIKPDSYTRWEAGCNFDSIKVRWDPTISSCDTPRFAERALWKVFPIFGRDFIPPV
jgi:hypothetical protein